MLTEKSMSDSLEYLGVDLFAFLPELILCGAIVLLLLMRLFVRRARSHLGWATLLLTLAALLVTVAQWAGTFTIPGLGEFTMPPPPSPPDGRPGDTASLFTGLLAYDHFAIFLRLFLLSSTVLIVWLSLLTGIPDREDSADFNCLLLGATLGMMLMASANHLLMVFLAVEMASLPSYALAGFLKGRRQSSEASLKYVVYGGGASGIMLYGISLLAGRFGTGYLPDVAAGFASLLHFGSSEGGLGFDPVLVLGLLFILIGLAFKLAAVPFHFWCPDVFEGAAAEVAAFLSVASKGAALALTGRFVLMLAGLGNPAPTSETWIDTARYLVPTLAVLAALTATFGNLAAYMQTNLKRLLAYSTIAHAGYMLMGLATLTSEGAAAVLFYLIAYLFMNLGAFAIVAFLRNQTGSEDLSSYRGLIQRSPALVVTLGIFLLSLLGIPPLFGFMAKFQVFSVLFQDGQMYIGRGEPALGWTLYALLVIGGLNTVVSVFYYIKVIKVMVLDAPEDSTPLRAPVGSVLYASLLAAVVVVLGIFWDPLVDATRKHGVDRFHAPLTRTTATASPTMIGD